MGQGLPVLGDVVLGAEHRQEPVARVVRSPILGDGPFQHRADAQMNGPGRRPLRVPDGREDLQHVGARHLRDRHLPDVQEGVQCQTAEPVPWVGRTPPPSPLLLDHAPSGFGERGYAQGAALLGQRVAARAGELTVGQRLLAGLGQRDQGEATEPELALAAPDHEPRDPAPRSRPPHVEVQAVAVAMPAGRGRAHEGGRQRVLGMAALGLGFPWDARWICPRPAWRRACFFSAMLRCKAAFRPPNSSRIRTAPCRMARSIRAISSLVSAPGSDGLTQLSSIVRARSSASSVRATATTSTDRPRSSSASQRPQCAAPQEQSAVVVACPAST